MALTLRLRNADRWMVLLTDDRLPCHANGAPLYGGCSTPDQVVFALLLKGYAKLYGGYAALRAGRVTEALVDFTGGVSHKVAPRTSHLCPASCAGPTPSPLTLTPPHPGLPLSPSCSPPRLPPPPPPPCAPASPPSPACPSPAPSTTSPKVELDLGDAEPEPPPATASGAPPSPAADGLAEVWQRLCALCESRRSSAAGCLLGCQQLAGGARGEAAARLGVRCGGWTYVLLDAVALHDEMLLCVRDPWAAARKAGGAWRGAWRAGAPGWSQLDAHGVSPLQLLQEGPGAAHAAAAVHADPAGRFWLSLAEFVRVFDKVLRSPLTLTPHARPDPRP